MQGITIPQEIQLVPEKKQEPLEQNIWYIDILSQDPKQQSLAHHIFTATFQDVVNALANAAPNNMLHDHKIVESPIYDDDINYIESVLFEDLILMQCPMKEIKNNSICIIANAYQYESDKVRENTEYY